MNCSMVSCKICNEEYDGKVFHKHLRYEHKTTIAQYYLEFFPQIDLFTGEKIEFKNKEQYLTTFYTNRNNMKSHLKQIGLGEASKVCQTILSSFKEHKGYNIAPSETEARSKMMPSPALITSLGLNYNAICQKVGLLQRFNYDNVDFKQDEEIKYIVDTREKKVLNLPIEKVTKLDFGDIVATNNPYRVFIERKSAPDLCSTVTSGLERFKREIERALKKKSYLIVLVERPISELLSVEYQSYMKYSYVKGEQVFHNIRELCQQYMNVQFAFCNGRPNMIYTIEKIYRCKTDPKLIDFQYLIDTKKI